MRPRQRSVDDRGSGAIWVLAVSMVVVLAGIAGVVRGVAAVARHRAEVAADFSALAAATRAIEGQQVACAAAGAIATANGARLASCHLAGSVATVEVAAHLGGAHLTHWQAHALARAGPAP